MYTYFYIHSCLLMYSICRMAVNRLCMYKPLAHSIIDVISNICFSYLDQVQVPSAQLLAGLQVQGGVSGGGTPVATLVKTVSTPSTLVHTPTTIPVSAINVTLPQARVTTAATVAKAATTQQVSCSTTNIPEI